MKILLAQINTVVGDIQHNTAKILEFLEKGRALGADLVVFPEMTLIGYPLRDLVLQNDLIEENLAALERICTATKGAGAILGFVDKNPSKKGKGLYNAAALCANGQILHKQYKTLLPTYDVFDEARYFDPAPSIDLVSFKGMKIGITICEDIWNYDSGEGSRQLYNADPVEEIAGQKPDLLVNISASPFTLGKRERRELVIREASRRAGATCIHVNHVGGNDSIIFDGWSVAAGSDGKILAQTSDFIEDAVLFDTETMQGERRPVTSPGMQRLFEALKLGLADYVRKCGFQKTVLGLSGGIDSALVAVIAVQALGPDRVKGVSMPSRFTSEGSKVDAARLAENLGIEYRELPIEGPYAAFLDLLEPQFDNLPFGVTEENIQARIRGILLMALSNKFGWLVLSTGNKSELAMGYCTLYGDMTGGLAVISDVPKTLVYDLARYINRDKEIIPGEILEKPPSAELRLDQKDSDTLPPYDVLDPIVRGYVEDRKSAGELAEALGHEKEFVQGILDTISQNEYKRRQAAPGLKVTSRAFGEGWRMPIAASRGKKK